MTLSRTLGLLAALTLTGIAAVPAQAQGSGTWHCYVAAESRSPKGLVISYVFEWTGLGRPPQNIMGSQFQKISAPIMPSADWPLSNCAQDRAQIERSRANRVSGYAGQGATVRQVDYVYE